MANPNIVSVTSIYGESIGEALTTTTTTAIMTVATHALVKINFIQAKHYRLISFFFEIEYQI